MDNSALQDAVLQNQASAASEFPGSLRLLICAGGTGGGVYPALAILQVLQEMTHNASAQKMSPPSSPKLNSLSVLWLGSAHGIEVELLEKAHIPFEAISAGQVHGVGLRALPGLFQLARGYFQARRIIHRFRPHIMLFTGGYLAVPVALAGRSIFRGRSVPSFLYVPDIEPGLALLTLSRWADCIALTAEDSRSFFPSRARLEVTGYPVRQEILHWQVYSITDKLAARRALAASTGFLPDTGLPTLLVFGGSKGARSINQALLSVLPDLLQDMQVIHISGMVDWPQVEAERQALPARLKEPSWSQRYYAFPYLHEEMAPALASADLVLSRAGASVLGEFTTLSLPAILVPYPHAWRYQQVNAQYLQRYGAAHIIQDADLPMQLLPVVRDLIFNPLKLANMRQAMRSLSQPDAAQLISHHLLALANRMHASNGASASALPREGSSQ